MFHPSNSFFVEPITLNSHAFILDGISIIHVLPTFIPIMDAISFTNSIIMLTDITNYFDFIIFHPWHSYLVEPIRCSDSWRPGCDMIWTED